MHEPTFAAAQKVASQHVHQAAPAEQDAQAIARILSFWFERKTPVQDWFGGSQAMDDAIAKQFAPQMLAAATGRCDHWQSTADGALALLILLDQFPRNIYRGKPRAFATDAQAVNVALLALGRGLDREVPFIRQIFFYLPLEHEEDLRSQVACVALTDGLVARAQNAEERKLAESFKIYALRHQATILRFGRYPSRNAALRRTSTQEEQIFLQKNPTGF